MNRRELFAGAGAAALSSAVPAACPGPVTATEIKDLQENARRKYEVEDQSTSIWVVCWGDGSEPYIASSLAEGLGAGRQLIGVRRQTQP